MTDPTHGPRLSGLKPRLARELLDYFVTFAYLAVFFTVFAWHRRLIMAEEHIPPADSWVPIIEAAILAKVILIIDLLGVAHRYESRPLLIPTLYKSALFAVGIVLFSLLEATVRGLLQHHSIMHGLHEFTRMNRNELLARVLSKSFALVPLFALRELARALGEGSLARLFFRGRREEHGA